MPQPQCANPENPAAAAAVQAPVIERILAHLGLHPECRRGTGARAEAARGLIAGQTSRSDGPAPGAEVSGYASRLLGPVIEA